MNILNNIPDDVLISSIGGCLRKVEYNKLLSLQRLWLPLLQRTRQVHFPNQKTLTRFMEDDKYRACVLQYASNIGICFIGNENIFLPFLHEYGRYVRSIPPATKYWYETAKVIRLYPHLKQFVQGQVLDIDLHLSEVHKLTRLRINQYHEVENMEDLDDATFARKQSTKQFQDSSMKTTRLWQINGIERVSISSNVKCALYLKYGAPLETVDLFDCHDLRDLSLFENIPQVCIHGAELLHDLSGMAHSRKVTINECNNVQSVEQLKACTEVTIESDFVQDLNPLANVSTLDFSSNIMSNNTALTDISALGNIQHLSISNASKLTAFPVPLGRGQRWSFANAPHLLSVGAFHNLESLCIMDCSQVQDIRMLGNVKYLSVIFCGAITRFPEPLGVDQQWSFVEVAISCLRGYHRLSRLHLLQCEHVSDVSMLSGIQTLHVEDCRQLHHIAELRNIQELTLRPPVGTPLVIGELDSIHHLHIYSTYRSHEASKVTIRQLHNIDNMKVTRVDLEVSQCDNVRRAMFDACTQLGDINIFAKIPMLSFLSCKCVTDVSILSAVEELSLTDCDQVQSIAGLHNLYGRAVPRHLMAEDSRWYFYGTSHTAI